MLSQYRRSLKQALSILNEIVFDPDNRTQTAHQLQILLLRRTIVCERRLRRAKTERKELKHSLSLRFPKEEARRIKYCIASKDKYAEGLRVVLNVYREIGDALAHTYIDRFDLKPFAFKQSHGFVSGKKGLRLERSVFRSLNGRLKPGYVVILNDLTNCLRHGDLTAAAFGHIVGIIEAKSGKLSSRQPREDRQSIAGTNLLEYIKTDKTSNLYGMDGDFSRASCHSAVVDHTVRLNQMIRRSRKVGSLAQMIEPGLVYGVFRGDISNTRELLGPLFGRGTRKWVVSIINEQKHLNVGHYPFPLSIFDADELLDFYNGDIVIVVAADLLLLKRRLRRHSLDASLVYDRDWCLKVTPIEGDGMIFVSNHFFNRIFAEFVSLRWMCDEIVYMWAEIEKEYSVRPQGG